VGGGMAHVGGRRRGAREPAHGFAGKSRKGSSLRIAVWSSQKEAQPAVPTLVSTGLGGNKNECWGGGQEPKVFWGRL